MIDRLAGRQRKRNLGFLLGLEVMEDHGLRTQKVAFSIFQKNRRIPPMKCDCRKMSFPIISSG